VTILVNVKRCNILTNLILGYGLSLIGHWSLEPGSWVPGQVGPGSWVLGPGTLGLWPWVLGLGSWVLGLEPWALGLGPWALELGPDRALGLGPEAR
jgi:hypothetical protein